MISTHENEGNRNREEYSVGDIVETDIGKAIILKKGDNNGRRWLTLLTKSIDLMYVELAGKPLKKTGERFPVGEMLDCLAENAM